MLTEEMPDSDEEYGYGSEESEETKYEEEVEWAGEEEEELQNDMEEVGNEITRGEHSSRTFFNPASLVKKTHIVQERPFTTVAPSTNSITDILWDEFRTPQAVSITKFTNKKEPTESESELVQMFYCLSSIMQTQIRDDMDEIDAFTPFSEYDLDFPSLSTDNGGNYNSLYEIPEKMMEWEDLMTKPFILSGRVPMFSTVFRFMRYLYESIKYESQCNIMAMVYVNRLTTKNNMAITVDNWRLLWLLAIMIAQKVWAHKPVRSSGFCKFFHGDLRKSKLKIAELKMLSMMDYHTGVPPSLYAKYYLELNVLYRGLVETLNIKGTWKWGELTPFTKGRLKRKNIKAEAEREAACRGKRSRK